MSAPDETKATRATVEAYEAAVVLRPPLRATHEVVFRLSLRPGDTLATEDVRAAADRSGAEDALSDALWSNGGPGAALEHGAIVLHRVVGLPMLEATEPPSCLAGGVTARTAAWIHYVATPVAGDPTTDDPGSVTCPTCLRLLAQSRTPEAL